MPDQPSDQWASGDAYERYMGRWSRKIAAEFLAWLDPDPNLTWLDAGCGTGALTATVLAAANPMSVTGIDPSVPFIDTARSHIPDPRARFEVADARSIPLDDASTDIAVSGLCLNFVPEPGQALAELARVTRPGGTIAAYVWDYAGGMQMLRCFWDSAITLDPAAAMLDEGPRFPLCAPEPLLATFAAAGLRDVETAPIDIETRFTDFDDYWQPFEGGAGPAPTYVQQLTQPRREALASALRRTLPTAPDGSIGLIARAWAVRGARPPA
jgi:SAM-dependent methyltransferase